MRASPQRALSLWHLSAPGQPIPAGHNDSATLLSGRKLRPLGVHTACVSEELVQGAKAAAELEPAVEAFAEATGALGPVRESTGWLGDVIRAKREAHAAKVFMKATEKIKASGLPAHAVRDKVLRAVVEDGSMEDDEGMQERWATLLANAATDQEDKIKLVYPKILAELEPKEALLLERLWEKTPNPAEEPFETVGSETTNDLVDIPEPYNLDRLGVLRWVRSMTTYPGSNSDAAEPLRASSLRSLAGPLWLLAIRVLRATNKAAIAAVCGGPHVFLPFLRGMGPGESEGELPPIGGTSVLLDS